ncbi:hypothetical protein BC938DRAFT_480805 [Jimgerdemannia flammicorona]|uniref:PX domain-containing protein n=1 Tax=Jimgerdemannia flammicorona TaxID=994334 RepID=A0A433QHT4_9FUNG|nr:hypothetical protein BC938DRAFT_480805 [Jimgerdemannia flammicorona]
MHSAVSRELTFLQTAESGHPTLLLSSLSTMTYLNNDDPNHEPAYIPPPHNDLEDGFLRITIIHLDRNRKDPLYKFDATTNLLRYKRSIFKSVERTYSEFERLHNHLSIVDEECLVPALPLFTTSAATPEEDERRARANMQRWFERITIHPRLSKDDELREFIQSDFGFLPQTKPRPARRPVGTLRMLTANLGLAAPVTVNDTDEQFVEFAEQVDEVTDCIAVAGRAVEKEVKARKGVYLGGVDGELWDDGEWNGGRRD